MFRKRWRYLLLTMILALAVLLYPVSYLEVRGGRPSNLLFLRRVSPGDRFEFRYIHSVDRTPVCGVFSITPRYTLKPVETRFSSYGAGLPWMEGRLSRGYGEIVAEVETEEMKQFSFFVSPMTRPYLSVKGERFDLSSLKEGDVIRIAVRRYPIGGMWLKHGGRPD